MQTRLAERAATALAVSLFAGMNPQDVTVTTAEGVTRFTFEGKPSSVYRVVAPAGG